MADIGFEREVGLEDCCFVGVCVAETACREFDRIFRHCCYVLMELGCEIKVKVE